MIYENEFIKLKNPGTRVIVRLLEKTRGKQGIKIVQKALTKMGKKLEIDGVLGAITVSAIKSVNNRKLHKIIEDLLFTQKNISCNYNWVKIAYDEIGVKEIKGAKSNKRIEQYHSVAGGVGWSDNVPWCGSFLAFVMTKAGYKPPQYPYRALSWLKFGYKTPTPCYGAIAVKKRKGGGHATIVVGRDKNNKYLYCLGGNQNDEVNIKKYNKNIFVAFMLPVGCECKDLPILKDRYNFNYKED